MNDFVLNEDMTEAFLEGCKRESDFQKKLESLDGNLFEFLFSENVEDVVGTIVNQETLSKLHEANNLLEIIGTMDDMEIEKFSEPDPKCVEGIVAVTIHDGIGMFMGAVYRALRRLTELADELMVMPRENETTRLVFSFHDLWSEYRALTADEIEKEKNLLEENHD